MRNSRVALSLLNILVCTGVMVLGVADTRPAVADGCCAAWSSTSGEPNSFDTVSEAADIAPAPKLSETKAATDGNDASPYERDEDEVDQDGQDLADYYSEDYYYQYGEEYAELQYGSAD